MDWSGLESASMLMNLKLWLYENIDRPLLLPQYCALDLFGLVSWYQHDYTITYEYLQRAISKCCKPFAWSIGYHDPVHISRFQSIISQHMFNHGTVQEP